MGCIAKRNFGLALENHNDIIFVFCASTCQINPINKLIFLGNKLEKCTWNFLWCMHPSLMFSSARTALINTNEWWAF